MPRQGILSAKEAQFQRWVVWKGSMDTVNRGIFLCAVMSSSFVHQRNQNEKLDIEGSVCHVLLQWHVPGFFYASSSLPLFFLCHSGALEFIIGCSTSTIQVSLSLLTFHQPRVICLFSWLLLTGRCCTLLQSCIAFVFVIARCCAYNATFFSFWKAHLSSGCWVHNDWLLSPRLSSFKIKIKYIWPAQPTSGSKTITQP